MKTLVAVYACIWLRTKKYTQMGWQRVMHKRQWSAKCGKSLPRKFKVTECARIVNQLVACAQVLQTYKVIQFDNSIQPSQIAVHSLGNCLWYKYRTYSDHNHHHIDGGIQTYIFISADCKFQLPSDLWIPTCLTHLYTISATECSIHNKGKKSFTLMNLLLFMTSYQNENKGATVALPSLKPNVISIWEHRPTISFLVSNA